MTARPTLSSLRATVRLSLAAAALALASASCDVHEFPVEEPGPAMAESRVLLRYSDLEMPIYTTVEFDSEGRRSSRAALSSADLDSRHIIKVYADNSNSDTDGTRGPSRAEAATLVLTDGVEAATADRLVGIALPPGRYIYLAWTDYGRRGSDDDLYYETTDFSEIGLRSTARDGLLFHEGNTPWRDAFRGEGRFTLGTDGAMYDADGRRLDEAVIDMRRPLARFVFVSTDLSDFISRHNLRPMGDEMQPEGAPRPLPSVDLSAFRIVVRYPGYMPSVFNNFIDKPVNSITGGAFEGAITGIDSEPGSAELGSDFVFVNGRESSVQVALDVYDRISGARVASTNPLTIPLVRNRLTVVRGRFLTSTAGSSIGINPGFEGDINIEIR